MTLSSNYAAVLASCVAVPQYPVFSSEVGEFQLRCTYGVNKVFWRAWSDVTLRIDAPSPPAQIYYRFYETLNYQVGDVPLLEVGGYLATCATPGTFLGTSQWLWMATLVYRSFESFNIPVRTAHIQYKNTNAGSVGLVQYPSSP